MNKRKEKLFDEKQFDNVQYAQDELEANEQKKEKCKKGLKFATIGTILSLIGYLVVEYANSPLGTVLLVVAVLIAVVSYFIGGGLGLALSTAWKICKVAWFIIPIFPFDLFFGMVGFFVAVMGFLFVPVLFVWINYHQVCKDYNAAEKYLQYCKVPSKTE